MKRLTLLLDEALLKEARQVLDTKTNSATVSGALTELLRVRKIQLLPSFFGRKLWHSDLAQMRGDSTPSAIRKRPKSRSHKI